MKRRFAEVSCDQCGSAEHFRGMSEMQHFTVESHRLWFVTLAPTRRDARKLGVEEFGRGQVGRCRISTKKEIEEYTELKGEEAMIWR